MLMEAKQPRNIARLAMDVGVSRQTLYTWGNEGCPLDEGAESVRAWRTEHHPPPSGITDQSKLARARLADAQAYAQEQKNLERDGQLYDATEVEQNVAELVNLIRHRLETHPEEIAADLPAECRLIALERMKDRVRLLLTEMSQWKVGDQKSTR